MRHALLATMVLLAFVPLGMAQQPADAQANPYEQAQTDGYRAAAGPNPYVQAQEDGYRAAATGQPNPFAQAVEGPIHPVQYPYNYFGAVGAPGFANPPRYVYAPAYGYDNGYGVNYYYVQNPAVNPDYRPPGAPPLPAATPSWPQPIQNLPPVPAGQVEVAVDGDPEGLTRAPASGISFRRPTNEWFWFNTDYTATLMRPMHMNGPLVTTGSLADNLPGAIGQPNTVALFGANSVDFGLFSGLRSDLGVFLDRENRFSLDVAGFYLFPNTSNYAIGSDANGNPVITRPYFNVATGFNEQFRFANSQQGLLAGAIAVDLKSQMAGLEFNARYHSYIQDRYHVDLLGGVRYLRLDETLQTREQVTALNGQVVPFQGNFYNPPDFITDQDHFRTINQFYGPQVGARLSWEERWFTFNGFVKLALGATAERTDINGSTTLYGPGMAPQTASGGVLALPSNSGTFSRTIFGFVPECGFDLSINLTPNARLILGYSFLYWNHVERPGSQYDLNINPGQVNSSFFYGQTTGPNTPVHRFNDEVFWTNSFNLGLEIHF